MAGYVLCVTSGESTTWHLPQRGKYAVAAFFESIEKNTQLKQENYAQIDSMLQISVFKYGSR